MPKHRKVTIVRLADEHRAEWERLYADYAAFYKVAQTGEMRETVWNWINDPDHEVEALVAIDDAGKPVGLAHYRPFARPLSAPPQAIWTTVRGARVARPSRCRCAYRLIGGRRPGTWLVHNSLDMSGEQLPGARAL